MPGNRKQQITQWTEQHDAYCLENKITPSAKLLWQWLIRQGEAEEIEPELETDFNKWVAKHRGKPFCPRTLKTALNQLIEHRIVQLVKRLWDGVRIITRPLDWLKPKKNFQNREKISTPPPPNDISADEGLYSSNIDLPTEEMVAECEAVLSECENAGIPFNPIQSPEILEYTLEEVRLAIALFHNRGGHQTNWRGKPKIANPQGWLLSCLRRGWHQLVYSWSFQDLLAALGVGV